MAESDSDSIKSRSSSPTSQQNASETSNSDYAVRQIKKEILSPKQLIGSKETQSYLENHTNSKLHKNRFPNALNEIREDEEIFIIQTTNDFDINVLMDQKINLKKVNIIEKNNQKYECVSERYTNDNYMTILHGNEKDGFKLKANSVKPTGMMRIREDLLNFSNIQENVEKNNYNLKSKISFPKHLRVRHPLLGYDYIDKIHMSEKIRAKLNLTLTQKKTKKFKLEKEIDNQFQIDDVDGFLKSPVKSKKRRFDEMRGEDLVENENFDALESKPKKIKKEKCRTNTKLESNDEVDLNKSEVVFNSESKQIKKEKKRSKIKVDKSDDDDLAWISQI